MKLQKWADKSLSLYKLFITNPSSIIATFAMFFMMMLTLVDVIGRYFFSMPITGGFEITEMMLALVIFLGIPLVTSEQDHITVDIIDDFIPAKVLSWLKNIVTAIGAVCFTVLAIMLWQHAFKILRYGDTTAVLEIPYSWISFLMAISVSLSALALYIIFIVKLSQPRNGENS
ncbi:TRAP transporter small permease [Marinomonas sp. THO17]|uniref:TRAP transporter small permease n=1 Tax=Marinomonas sp. THO17 TaxID=3149048 RepID=UPI00336BC669